MFSVNRCNRDGLEVIVLTDEVTKTQAEVLPACGGILSSFSFINNDNQRQNILLSYDSQSDFYNHVASKGFRGSKLSPFACRIHKGEYLHLGKPYKFQKFYLEKHALHGLLYDRPFVVTEIVADEKSARVTMHYSYQKEDAGYPFCYDCRIEYELCGNHQLHVRTTLTNRSDIPIPMQDGWHPYFTFGKPIDQLELKLNVSRHWFFNDEMIPTGESVYDDSFTHFSVIDKKRFDDCFSLNPNHQQPKAMLRDPAAAWQLEIFADDNYSFLQIYTPDDRNSIAIENLSGLPDCFNNGIGKIVLAPEESKMLKTTYALRNLRH